ncbi:hypothetical protein D3C84_1191360 [compost metagenome]
MGPDVTAVIAFQQLRCAAGELDVFDTALELAHSIFRGLAVLLADQLRDLVFVLL